MSIKKKDLSVHYTGQQGPTWTDSTFIPMAGFEKVKAFFENFGFELPLFVKSWPIFQ